MNRSIVVLLVAILCLSIWLYLYQLSYSNMYIKNKITLMMSSAFGVPVSYAYSIFATVLYCFLPLMSCFIVAAVAKMHMIRLFYIPMKEKTVLVAVLAVIGVMSIMAVFLMIILSIAPKIKLQEEMSKIKWIEGIFMTPSKIAWMLPMFSACFEEFFFEGYF